MYFIGKLFGLNKHYEVLLIILIGFGISVFDSSLFNLKRNIEQIWDLILDIRIYPIMHQIYIKYILTAVVLTRTFTLHLCLALYVVMLWPAVFGDRHNLLLPWLAVGIFRYLLANLTTLLLGSYLCITHEGLKPVCFEYVLAQFIDHGPAVYSWFVVLSFYKELKIKSKEDQIKQNEFEVKQLIRRKKARSMSLHLKFNEKADDGRNLISESTIETLLHHLQNTVITKSRSLDSLLAFKAAEEEKEEIMNTEDFSEEKDNQSENNVCERAKKLLNILSDDITKAKQEQSGRTLKILSDITLDALTYVGTSRILSKVSSASFFIKKGVAYRYKNIRFAPSQTLDSHFYDCIEEENVKQNENELVNMFLETDKEQK